MVADPAIYLDANATTPVDLRVAEAMLAALTGLHGNPSSAHAAGRDARRAVEAARCDVARLIGADRPDEVVFTSGGSESNVTAIRAALGPGTALVTLMTANNETGTLFPIADLVPAAHAAGALFHTDAVQAAGRVALSVAASGVDMASFSAHKLHGPKGVGALHVRTGTPFSGLIVGGRQEKGRRAGTENVPGIVGFGVAARLAFADCHAQHIARLRDRLESAVVAALPGMRVLGDPKARLANTACLAFPGVDAEMMLHRLDRAGIAASSGSACAAGSLAPSHVLTAMCLRHLAGSTIRFSLSRFNTDADIDRLLASLPAIASEARILETVA